MPNKLQINLPQLIDKEEGENKRRVLGGGKHCWQSVAPTCFRASLNLEKMSWYTTYSKIKKLLEALVTILLQRTGR